MATTDCNARLATFLLCVFALNSHSAEVARVGNEPITVENIRQVIARNGLNIYSEDSARKALDEAVRFELLATEAKKLGYDKDPSVVQQMKQLMVQKLVAEKIDAGLRTQAVSDSELESYYKNHTNEFAKPTMTRGSMLTILISGGKEADAKKRIESALTDLRSGDRFEIVARKYSDDPSERISGGAGTWLVENQPNRRYPPEVVQAMFKLRKAGELSDPIRGQNAFYLVGLVEKREGELPKFEQVKGEVGNRLARARREQAYDKFCENLRKEFPVTVNEAELRKAVEPTLPNAGPPRGPVDLPVIPATDEHK